MFRQILLTSSIRNVWRTVRRICIFISGPKGLSDVPADYQLFFVLKLCFFVCFIYYYFFFHFQDCPDRWRQYHLTVSELRYNPALLQQTLC